MYKKSLAIYALIALLALTPLLAAIPITPASAAVQPVEVSIDYNYTVEGTWTTRTISVYNPPGNPGIKSITVSIPTSLAQSVPPANLTYLVAPVSASNKIVLDSVTDIRTEGNITIGSETVKVIDINPNTKTVTLNENLTGAYDVNTPVTCSFKTRLIHGVIAVNTIKVADASVFRVGDVIIVSQSQGVEVTNEPLGTGDGKTTVFSLKNKPVVSGSVTIKLEGEVIGTGDGKTTVFSGTLTNPPVIPNSVIITATVGGTKVTIKDDGSGNLKDTGVTGTINYATGSWALTFTTPPDSGTSITADYITKGYSIDYATGKITFNVAPANGVKIFANYKYIGTAANDETKTIESIDYSLNKITLTTGLQYNHDSGALVYLKNDPNVQTTLAAAVDVSSAQTITVGDVSGFQPGDTITVVNETATIGSISVNTITLTTGLLYSHAEGELVSYTVTGRRLTCAVNIITVKSVANLKKGDVITVVNETATIKSIDVTTNKVTLATPLAYSHAAGETITKPELQKPQPTDAKGFLGTVSKSVSGLGPWAIQVSSSSAVMLPGGAKGKFNFLFMSALEEEAGVPIKDNIVVVVTFEGNVTTSIKLPFYVGRATSVTVTRTTTEASLKVGKTFSFEAAVSPADEGLLLSLSYTPEVEEGFTASLPANVSTDANGKATFKFTCTQAGTYTVKASYGTPDEFSSGGIMSETYATVTYVREDPSTVSIKVYEDSKCKTSMESTESAKTYLYKSPVYLKVSLADKYGNAWSFAELAASLKLTTSYGTFENGKDTYLITPATETVVVAFYPPTKYGASFTVSAEVTVPSTSTYAGTYSGSSKPLFVSFLGTTAEPTVYLGYKKLTPVDNVIEVEAGKTVTIRVQLKNGTADLEQSSVPVRFSIAEAKEGEGYGQYSDYKGKLSVAGAQTDESGIVSVDLKVDTRDGAACRVRIDISRPTASNTTDVVTVYTPIIETVPSKVAAVLVVEPADDVIAPNKTTTVDVYLADVYGNKLTGGLDYDVSVVLSASEGVLSVTQAVIKAGKVSLSDSGYTVLFKAPAKTCNVTITAYSPLPDIVPGSATISVLGPQPIVVIEYPAKDVTVETTLAFATVNVSGYAKVSPASPATFISRIAYSVDGEKLIDVPKITTKDDKYIFNLTLTLEANKTHTVTIFAEDSEGYNATASRKITVAYKPAGLISLTEGATLDATGKAKTAFSSGEEVKIKATITNTFNTAKSIIVRITFLDPNRTPQYPIYELSLSLAPGMSITPTATYIAGAVKGAWTAKVMVIDATTGEALAAPIELTITVV